MSFAERLKQSLKLLLIFLKIGAFTFGGGYAMIPIIEYELTEKRKLITKEEISDIVAIAESTPGPIAINSATFVGFRTCGVLGSAFATLGVVLPSFVLISLIAFFLPRIMDYRVVKYAFFGIRAGVLALIVKAFWGMLKKAEKSVVSYAVMICVFAAVVFCDVSVVLLLILCALLGLGVTAWKGRAAK